MRLGHYREGDLSLSDGLEEQVMRPSRSAQVALEEMVKITQSPPWPRIGGFLLVLGGAHAAPHILWLAGAHSYSHNRHLGAEAGHPLARCPLPPHL
jgi:hypothetical protein